MLLSEYLRFSCVGKFKEPRPENNVIAMGIRPEMNIFTVVCHGKNSISLVN